MVLLWFAAGLAVGFALGLVYFLWRAVGFLR